VLALFDAVAETDGCDARSFGAKAEVIEYERETCETSVCEGPASNADAASNAGGVARGASATNVRSLGRAGR
jgi:hypothetical protein